MVHNLHVSETVQLVKHVVVLRSTRHQHWVATVAGRSTAHSGRILGMLYDSVSSYNYTAKLNICFEPNRLLRNGEESVS
jgi:hypothetical protein